VFLFVYFGFCRFLQFGSAVGWGKKKEVFKINLMFWREKGGVPSNISHRSFCIIFCSSLGSVFGFTEHTT